MNQTGTLCDLRINQASFEDHRSLEAVVEAIRTCLREGSSDTLRAFFDAHEPADLAAFLDLLPADEALAAMRQVDTYDQALILGYLTPTRQVEVARRLNRRDLAGIVAAMSHDERADLFNRLDPDAQEAVLPGLAQAERDDLRRLASYPEGTVGSVMTSDYATLASTARAGEAIEALRLQAPDSETIYQAYVVEPDRRLVGTISLRELLLAHPSTGIADIMDP